MTTRSQNRHTRLSIPTIATLLLVFAPALPAQQTPPDNGAKTDEEVIVLEEFQVRSTTDNDNYIATDTIGVRTAARLTETPYSIQSLTSEFINDFMLYELADQLNFVAGGFPGASDTGANNGKAIRGFNPVVLRDGFSEASPPHNSLIDRVEIIRGPASALFGQAEPGGIVNYVSKRPVRRPKYLVRGSYAPNYNGQSLTLTASGPLLPGKLFYLSNFSYNYTENPLDYFYRRGRVFALALTYYLTPRTLLTLALEKQPEHSNQGAAVLLYQQRIGGTNYLTGRAPGGLEHFNAQGPYNHLKRDFECVNLLIEHRFSPNLIIRANLQTYDKQFDQVNYRLDTTYINETALTYNVEPRAQDQDSDAKHAGFDMNWRKQIGGVWHSFLLVGDYHLSKVDESIYAQPGDRSLTRINPHNPIWLPLDPYNITQVYQRTRRKTESYGLLMSHRAFFFRNRLITMASLRHDKVRRPYYNLYQNVGASRIYPLGGTQDGIYAHWQSTGELPEGIPTSGFSVASRKTLDEKDEATTFSVGANLKLFGDALVFYANYGTGFTISNTYDQGNGNFMPNITSRGVEIGFKGSFLGDHFIYTLSAYNIKKKGVPVTNDLWNSGIGANPDIPQFLGDGIDRSKGFDGEIKWKPSSGLTLTVGGACMEPTTYSRAITPMTDRMINIPRVNAYATTVYNFKNGVLKGLGLGGSITHQGDRLVGRVSGSRLRMAEPSTTLAGCFASYAWKKGKWQNSLRLNVTNLFDKEYWSSISYLAKGREASLTYTLSY